ncbi:MAG: Zn-ribbon domain-containing OB-fold protein [Alphaproteobacteria bacterium]|nr:Zn-ribbon domain-containing OB-fold protein [Alphaproteobacteria bacterium]MCB9929584.1 Zn-ribbon domain-containing OB-fold protein [Alphaproteobacteria bacterium]
MSYNKPVPAIDPDSAPYWEGAKAGKLMIQRCKATGQAFLYSRQLVPGVVESEVEWIEASGKGTIYSFTVARRPAGQAFADVTPYVIVSVELEEGARVMSNLVTDDPDSVAIGQPVEVVFDAVTDDLTIPKFKRI